MNRCLEPVFKHLFKEKYRTMVFIKIRQISQSNTNWCGRLLITRCVWDKLRLSQSNGFCFFFFEIDIQKLETKKKKNGISFEFRNRNSLRFETILENFYFVIDRFMHSQIKSVDLYIIVFFFSSYSHWD